MKILCEKERQRRHKFIKENAGTMTARQMAKELNVPPYIIRHTAHRINVCLTLNTDKQRRERVDKFIFDNWETMKIYEMARLLGEEQNYILGRMRKYGLSKGRVIEFDKNGFFDETKYALQAII